MADMDCLMCGSARFADFDLCQECLQKTMPKQTPNKHCVFDECSDNVLDELDVCGKHLIETIYCLSPPYTSVFCNIEGCLEKSRDEYHVCEKHWAFAYKMCLEVNAGKHIAKPEITIMSPPLEQLHYNSPALPEDDAPVAPAQVPTKICKCGEPADPKGNMCAACFNKFKITKFGRGKCLCGEPLGEKGNMCGKCFLSYKKDKFGSK